MAANENVTETETKTEAVSANSEVSGIEDPLEIEKASDESLATTSETKSPEEITNNTQDANTVSNDTENDTASNGTKTESSAENAAIVSAEQEEAAPEVKSAINDTAVETDENGNLFRDTYAGSKRDR